MVRKSSKTKNRRLVAVDGLRMLLPAERFIYEMFMDSSVKPVSYECWNYKAPPDFENIKVNRDLA